MVILWFGGMGLFTDLLYSLLNITHFESGLLECLTGDTKRCFKTFFRRKRRQNEFFRTDFMCCCPH